jgi:glucokinase
MLLGLEISRHDAAVILASPQGEAQLALRQEFAPNLTPAAQWLAAMDLCQVILGRAVLEPHQITRAAVVLDAQQDSNGIVLRDPYRPGWEGYDLRRGLREHLGIQEILTAPRARADALGELRYGVLKESRDWLYFHLGRSLEGAAMSGGAWIVGANNVAGDLGGIILDRDGAVDAYGRRGSLAAYCGGDAFEARCRSYGLTFHRAHEVWDLAASNFAAQSVVEDFVARLSQGLTSATAILNPAVLCLGGAFANAIFPRLQPALALKMREMGRGRAVETIEIRQASLGEDAAVLGAVALTVLEG